jgi:hypothetical protein
MQQNTAASTITQNSWPLLFEKKSEKKLFRIHDE